VQRRLLERQHEARADLGQRALLASTHATAAQHVAADRAAVVGMARVVHGKAGGKGGAIVPQAPMRAATARPPSRAAACSYCTAISPRRAWASDPPAPISTNTGGLVPMRSAATPSACSACFTAIARSLASFSFAAVLPVLSV